MTNSHSTDWLERIRTAVSKPLTAGNLADYNLCPRKFLLSQFAASGQRRALGATRALHSAIRATLVAADMAGGPARLPLQWLRDEFLRRFDGSACADSLEEEQTRKLGVRMLAQFQARQREAATELVAADLRIETTLADLPFVAVADRVERDGEGRLIVARYDVRRDVPGPERLARDMRAGLLVALAERHFGERPIARIYALRKDKVYDAEFADAAIEAISARAVALARAIRADVDFSATPGDHCLWCRVRAGCDHWRQRQQSLLQSGGQ